MILSFHESEGEGGDLPSLAAKHLPDLAASLCGGLDTRTVSLVSFEQHGITYEQVRHRNFYMVTFCLICFCTVPGASEVGPVFARGPAPCD